MSLLQDVPQPAVFVSHGSPMTAIEKGPYPQALAAFGQSVRPRAIIVISAHWQDQGLKIGAAAQPEMIYDFGGFPRELYEIQYPAPGSPELAVEASAELGRAGFDVTLEKTRGLDHGAWVPLRLMFPEARIPVVPISLPLEASPQEMFRIGASLSGFRKKGVLIMGSGGIVHNLRLMHWAEKVAPVDTWAQEFQNWVRDAVQRRDLASLFDYEKLAPHVSQAVPTDEHFLPLFPVLGAAAQYTQAVSIFEGVEYGNMSMYSFQLR